jgi:photosystem II stability/assembly factor-like uncharacterized protein
VLRNVICLGNWWGILPRREKGRDEKMKPSWIACLISLTLISSGLRAASAIPCVVSGPRYGLVADTVDWSMKIGSGRNCARDFRFNTALSTSPAKVVVENVKLVSPPQSGQVTIEGSGFSYSAKSDFQGKDSFAVAVSGANNGKPGSSTIRIDVSVGGVPSAPVAPAPPARPTAATVSRTDKLPYTEALSGMSWQTLKIGGGGFITGIDIASDGTKVVRTDVYGAYIYNTTTNLWQQIVTVKSMSTANAEVGTGQGVYEIAIAPSNTQRFYMIFNGYLFRSDDRGTTWSRTAFKQEKAANPNDNYRGFGRKIAVDPANPDVVYVGVPSGLFVSTNGGTSWSSVSGIAVPSTAAGGVIIAFDPSSIISGGKTQGIYASSYGHGVYHSTDGGTTWTLTTSTPTTHMHMFADVNGSVWLVDDINGNEGAGDLHKYANGKWSTISAVRLAQSVTVDPLDASHIFVLDFDGRLMISVDSGSTWVGPTRIAAAAPDIPWIAATNTSVFSSADIKFDPSARNKLYNATGIGVFYTNPPTTNTEVTWTSQTAAIEELVSSWIVSPPGGNPILTAWDRPVFTVTNPDVYPSGHGLNYANEIIRGASADWASLSPSTVVVIANNFAPIPAAAVDTSGYSSNGGQTWSLFGSNAPYSMNKTAGGCIAASTSKNFVWVPTDGAGDNSPWYTIDGGNTWHAVAISGVPTSRTTGWGFIYYLNRQICAADRVNANTFYLYNDGSGSAAAAGIYKSTDGGATWSRVYKSTFANAGFSAQMRSVPGHAGNLFFTAGAQGPPHSSSNGFYRSTDGGTSWSAVSNVREVYSFGFGKPAPGQLYPAIFIAGWVSHGGGSSYNYGVWRSIDNASTWTEIGDGFPTGSFEQIEAVEGDSNTFGTVYVGTTGNGWYYGKLN